MFWFLLAMIAGALIAVQGPVYTRMSVDLGGALPAAWLAFTLGSLVLLSLSLMTDQGLPTLQQARALPLWAWPGAVIGVAVVLISVAVIPRTGVSTYVVAAIAGQLLAGWFIDRTGVMGMPVREFSSSNIIGLMLVIAGVALVRFR